MTYHPTAYTITTSGKTLTQHDFMCSVLANPSAADLTVTLPKSTRDVRGMEVFVMNIGTSSSVGLTVAINSADLLHGTGITAAAGKGLINTHGTEAVGDCVHLKADGNGKWLLMSKSGTWARVA